MFFSLPILIYAVIYISALEIASYFRGNLAIVAIILAAAVLFTVSRAKVIGRLWSYVPTPAIFSFSAAALLYLINFPLERQIFIVISGFLYYVALIGILRLKEYAKDETARGLMAAATIATLYYFYTSIYGFYLNFAVPLWFLMTLFMFVTVVVSYQYFSLFSSGRRNVRLISLVLGLSVAEIGWVINFWPFGYLTTGVVMLMIFYVFWDLAQSYFLDDLSKRRVLANLVFILILIAMVLATSRWLPAV